MLSAKNGQFTFNFVLREHTRLNQCTPFFIFILYFFLQNQNSIFKKIGILLNPTPSIMPHFFKHNFKLFPARAGESPVSLLHCGGVDQAGDFFYLYGNK